MLQRPIPNTLQIPLPLTPFPSLFFTVFFFPFLSIVVGDVALEYAGEVRRAGAEGESVLAVDAVASQGDEQDGGEEVGEGVELEEREGQGVG